MIVEGRVIGIIAVVVVVVGIFVSGEVVAAIVECSLVVIVPAVVVMIGRLVVVVLRPGTQSASLRGQVQV